MNYLEYIPKYQTPFSKLKTRFMDLVTGTTKEERDLEDLLDANNMSIVRAGQPLFNTQSSVKGTLSLRNGEWHGDESDREAKIEKAKDIAVWMPYVGDAVIADEAIEEAKKGNYATAAGLGALLALPYGAAGKKASKAVKEGLQLSKLSKSERILAQDLKAAGKEIKSADELQDYLFAILDQLKNSGNTIVKTGDTYYLLNKDNIDILGAMQLLKNADKTYTPVWIENFTRETDEPIKGMSRMFYDAAISDGKVIRSGAMLEEPGATIATWKHYPDKQLVGNYGTHGTAILRPVWDLTHVSDQYEPIPMEIIDLSKIKIEKRGGKMNILDYLKEGSEIRIKKKNRGKFTDYCGGKVTEECIARGKRSPSATIRKRATFAANARKWKHEDGGIVKAGMGTALYIGTGRNTQRSQEGLTLEQYKQLLEETSKYNPQGPDVILPEEIESKTPVATSTEQTDWTNEFKIDNKQAGPVQQVNPTVAAATYTSSSTNLNKDRLREALKKRGLDDDTVDALLVQAGAESGYNYQIKNPNSSAYGLGQWIAANHKPVIDHVNQTRNKNYTKITDLDFDDQAEALAWWYYDRNKDKLDSQQGLFNKAKVLAKIGLSPAILAGSYTYKKNGKTYRDTDEDWLAWFTDTGHNPNGKIKTFDDHVRARLRHAGYTQV